MPLSCFAFLGLRFLCAEGAFCLHLQEGEPKSCRGKEKTVCRCRAAWLMGVSVVRLLGSANAGISRIRLAGLGTMAAGDAATIRRCFLPCHGPPWLSRRRNPFSDGRGRLWDFRGTVKRAASGLPHRHRGASPGPRESGPPPARGITQGRSASYSAGGLLFCLELMGVGRGIGDLRLTECFMNLSGPCCFQGMPTELGNVKHSWMCLTGQTDLGSSTIPPFRARGSVVSIRALAPGADSISACRLRLDLDLP